MYIEIPDEVLDEYIGMKLDDFRLDKFRYSMFKFCYESDAGHHAIGLLNEILMIPKDFIIESILSRARKESIVRVHNAIDKLNNLSNK